MSNRFVSFWNGRKGEEEPARDGWTTHALQVLDPATADPSYWLRFRNAVTLRAMGELARRRRLELTMGDLVLSWSRTLIPATVLAAAVASFLLLRSAPVVPVPRAVEEILSEGLVGALDGTSSAQDVEISFTAESF